MCVFIRKTSFSESRVVRQGCIYVFTAFCAPFLDTSAVNSDPFHQSSVYIYFCPHTTSVTNNRRLQYQCWNSVNRAVQLRASALSSHVDTQGHNRHFEDFFGFNPFIYFGPLKIKSLRDGLYQQREMILKYPEYHSMEYKIIDQNYQTGRKYYYVDIMLSGYS